MPTFSQLPVLTKFWRADGSGPYRKASAGAANVENDVVDVPADEVIALTGDENNGAAGAPSKGIVVSDDTGGIGRMLKFSLYDGGPFSNFDNLGPVLLITFAQLYRLEIEGSGVDVLALTKINAPNLTIVDRIYIDYIPNLAELSLPLLTRGSNNGSYDFSNNPKLTTFSLPSWEDNSGNLGISNCALSAESVNAILARLVAISYTGAVDLSGGTSAAPTGQGLTDKQTLIDAGASVTTN